MKLTLVTNDKPAYVDINNVSFAIEMDEVNEETGEEQHFTRIFLKEIAVPFDKIVPWVDVKEPVSKLK